MSMITGCPACGTLFRVVPDQLRISEGWVRCGHCGEVFDAGARLRPEASLPAGGVPEDAPAAPAAEQPQPQAPADDPAPLPSPAVADPIEVGPPGIAPLEVPPAGVEPVPVATLFVRAEADTAPAPVASDSQFPASDGFADAQFGHDALTPDEEKALRPPGARPAGEDTRPGLPPPSRAFEDSATEPVPLSRSFAPSTAQPVDDAYPDDLSFVREARRDAYWRSPAMRGLLVAGVLVLAGLLAAQYALHDRNRLAAQHPSLRPWLDVLCAAAGCTVGPPQRIEAVVIDNSGFARVRPDTYRLSVSLRNASELPVAVPALQLTLTDSQEQPVVRRVFTPRELGATSDAIPPSSEFSASLVLAAAPGESAARIAGYRLLAFYP